MARLALTGMTSGELSPLMIGRADVQRYHMAARLLENFIVHPTGLLEFREGWMYLGTPKSQTTAARLVPFVYSDEQAYMLEFGDLYVRFWKDGGIIVSAGVPVELATPWPAAELALLSFTQSADVLWIFHEDGSEPQKLSRLSHTSWTLTDWQIKDGPFLQENLVASRTLGLSGVGGVVDVTAAGYPAGQGPFKASDVGRHLRIMDRWEEDTVKKTQWNWGIINAYIAPDHVQLAIQERGFHTPAPTAEASWRLGTFGTGPDTGFPIAGTIQEQRFWVAGCRGAPERADASKIGDYVHFSPGPNDNDGIGIGAATPRVNRLRALLPLNDVIALSAGAEIRIGAGNERQAITPSNVSAKPMSNFGAAKGIPALPAGNGALFVDRNRRRVLEYAFDFGLNAYRAQDLTVLAEHIAGDRRSGGFSNLAWLQNPVGLIWAPRQDGQIAVATYDPNEKVLAWGRHLPGAAGVCESIATLPGSMSENPVASPGDEVWAVFRRDTASGPRRSIERLRITDPATTPNELRCHLDSAMTLDNAIAIALNLGATAAGSDTTATAAAPLWVAGDVGRFITQRTIGPVDDRGEAVWRWSVAEIMAVTSATVAEVNIRMAFADTALAANAWRLTVKQLTGLPAVLQDVPLGVVADGRYEGLVTSTGSTLTLPNPASIVHIGYPYTGTVLTLPFDVGPVPASMQGRPARIDRVTLRVLRTVGGGVGTEQARMDSILNYSALEAAPMAPPRAVTKDIQLAPAGDYTGWPAYWMRQSSPLPFNVALQVPNIYSPAVQP